MFIEIDLDRNGIEGGDSCCKNCSLFDVMLSLLLFFLRLKEKKPMISMGTNISGLAMAGLPFGTRLYQFGDC